MLYQIFMQILQMGVTASVVIVAVLCVRGVMHRLPKKYLYLLWAVVGIRLVCPVAVASPVSIFNIAGADFMVSMKSADQEGLPGRVTEQRLAVGTMQDHVVSVPLDQGQGEQNVKKIPGDSAISGGDVSGVDMQTEEYSPVVRYGLVVWLIGMAVILFRNLYVTIQMKKCLEKAVRYQGNIYECDNIPSPFVLGIVRPRIYIPFRLEEREREYILKHEQYHIKRRDYIIKVAAFLLTCVYWFHPLVWLSYFLMIRDMEMSCDEYVLQSAPEDIRASYSKSLLGFAVNRRGMTAGLLAFGETDTRKRVRNVLNFKKYKRWAGVIAIVLVAIAGTVCLTNARDEETKATQNIGQGTMGDEENKQDDKNQGIAGEMADRKGNDEGYEAIVASGEAHGYQVQVVYTSDHKIPDKQDLDFGMYEGEFEIRTYKNNAMCADYQLRAEDKMYFPADGFVLGFKDYDGDGAADDFALGQGQTPEPAFGNFMSYWFFAVDEDGGIAQYALSTENGEKLVTVPGEYSKVFACQGGEIVYQALTENGTEEQTAEVCRGVESEMPNVFEFEGLGVTIKLPENTSWIQNPEAFMDGIVGVVDYYDGIAETDVTLRFGKEGQKEISEFASDASDPDDEYWSYFDGSVERFIRVKFYTVKNSLTTVVLSWQYSGIAFYMQAEFSDMKSPGNSAADNWPTLAKSAAYIANEWCNMIRKSGGRSFSESSIQNAKKAIKSYFKKNFEDCEIKRLWYDEELYKSHVTPFTDRYGKGRQVIIVYSDFYVEKKCKINSLNKDFTYKNFMWILSREEGSEWKVQDYGY